MPIKLPLSEQLQMPLRLAFLTAAYFATGWFGLSIPSVGTHITLIWLPTGIAVAALLCWGRRVWPGIYLGALLTNWFIGSSLPLAASIAIGNTLGPLLVAVCLERFGFRATFERQRDVGYFVAAACMGMAVSATSGITCLTLAGLLPLSSAGFAWLTWWMGDTVGVLLATPLVLSLLQDKLRQFRHAPVETVLWGLAACLIAWLAFIHEYTQLGSRNLPLAFATLPVLAWAAIRFGIVGAAIAGLGFSLAAVWGTAMGRGAISVGELHVSLILLWSYMAVAVVTGLIITALQAERLRMEASLRANEEKLRGLYELSPLGIALANTHGKFIEFNDAFRAICGYSEDELKRLDYWELTPKRYEADENYQLEMLAKTGRYGPYEKEYVRKNGSLVPLQLNGMLITGPDDQQYIWSIVEDITSRKQNQQHLEYLLAEQKAILENDVVSISIIKDRIIIWANPAMEKMLGYAPAMLAGIPARTYFRSDEAYEALRAAAYPVVLAGKVYRTQQEWLRTDGTSVWVDLSGAMLRPGEFLWAAVDITERKQLEDQLRESEAYNKMLFQESHRPIVVLDPSQGFIDCNPAAIKIYGYSCREEVLGKFPIDVSAPIQYDGVPSEIKIAQQDKAALEHGLEVFEWRHQRPNGEVWDALVYLMAFNYRGRHLLQFTLDDITERKRAADELRIAAAAFESQEGMAVTDANDVILRVNQAFSHISGYSGEAVIGMVPRMLYADPESAQCAAIKACIAREGKWQGEMLYRHKGGEIYPVLAAISAVYGSSREVTHYVHTFVDITEQKKAEELIRHLAFYDQLTGLPNRRLLLDRLQQALPASARGKRHGAVCFLDMDKFKLLNDSHGHDKGDLLLQQVAQRLLGCVRKGDTVARLGGDEFVLVLETLSESRDDALAQMKLIGDKVLTALSQPFVLGELTWHCSASIGATLFYGESETVEDLIKQADSALYQAKWNGRNALRFYQPCVNESEDVQSIG